MRRAIPPTSLPDPESLFEDEHIFVVSKPSMLLSVPGRGPDKADCVVARLANADCPEPLVIHRLDMETSGILVLAKTKEAQSHISKQFTDRSVQKSYEAVVAGQMAQDTFTVDLPLITDWPNRPKQMVSFEMGKPALTHGRVMDSGPDQSRVELVPHTGRSHQLRVHMLSLGHVILGDSLYANDEAFESADRLLLHAKMLSFQHPISGEAMTFHSPAPF